MVAVLNEMAGNGSDLIFCFHVGLVPDGIGQVCLRAVAENRTAVGLGGVALLFQLVQIAANCFLCNVIILGKVADKYTLFRAQLAARLTAAPTPVSRALMLNTATRRVTSADGEVRLSVRECAMLAALGKGGSLSRADAAALFGSAAGNVVDVYACYLRKKLGKVLTGEIICARRGEGYALAEDVTLEVL